MQIDTVKVKCQACEGNEAGEMIINQSDYEADPGRYELVGVAEAPISDASTPIATEATEDAGEGVGSGPAAEASAERPNAGASRKKGR